MAMADGAGNGRGAGQRNTHGKLEPKAEDVLEEEAQAEVRTGHGSLNRSPPQRKRGDRSPGSPGCTGRLSKRERGGQAVAHTRSLQTRTTEHEMQQRAVGGDEDRRLNCLSALRNGTPLPYGRAS